MKLAMRTSLALAVLLAIAPCAAAAPTKGPALDKKLIDAVKVAIEYSLKDPASVQYRNVRVVNKKDGRKAVCGEFNAKNSFGGYGGFDDSQPLATTCPR